MLQNTCFVLYAVFTERERVSAFAWLSCEYAIQLMK